MRMKMRIASLGAALCLALAGFWTFTAATAHADDQCGPDQVAVTLPGGVQCVAKTTDPGSGGGGDTANGGVCNNDNASVTHDGTVYPCLKIIGGVRWNYLAPACYETKDLNPPPLTDPIWFGHIGDNGTVMWNSCAVPYGPGNAFRHWERCTTVCATPTPEELESRISMLSPVIGMSPGPGTSGFVNENVWFWTTTDLSDLTQDASTGNATITLHRALIAANWRIIDSKGVVVKTLHCRSDHERTNADGAKPSPDPECGYKFPKPDAGYTISAQASWSYTAIINGVTTNLTVTPPALTTTIAIKELQSTNG